jgi:hypothetical protein
MKIKKILGLSVIAASPLASIDFAQGALIKFTAGNFTSFNNSLPAWESPEPIITAYFDYTGDPLGVMTVNSFDLTIDGKVWGLADIEWLQWDNVLLFGGPSNGLNGMHFGVPDFTMLFNATIPTNGSFSYTVAPNEGRYEGWWAGDTTSDMVDVSSVDETGALALLGVSLFALSLARRKH